MLWMLNAWWEQEFPDLELSFLRIKRRLVAFLRLKSQWNLGDLEFTLILLRGSDVCVVIDFIE